jgi:type II secretory pathway pseudopilin PulG
MHRRKAFTLVELLVSLALIIFIMSILAQAFYSATKAFTDLKSLGDMAERLRAVSTLMRHDLAAQHFSSAHRLSDDDFWGPVGGPYAPPTGGYFRIWQGSAKGAGNYINESPGDSDYESYRVTDTYLAFTATFQGNLRSNFYKAILPGSASNPDPYFQTLGAYETRYQDIYHPGYNFPTAEVMYFLRASANANTPPVQDTAKGTSGNTPTPLFALYRRSLVAVPSSLPPLRPPNTATPGTSGIPYGSAIVQDQNGINNFIYAEISIQPTRSWTDPVSMNPYYWCNNLNDLTFPGRRFGMNPATPASSNDPVMAGLPLGKNALGNAIIEPTAPPGEKYLFPTEKEDCPSFFAADDLLLTDVISFEVKVLLKGDNDFRDLSDPAVKKYSFVAGTPNNTQFGGTNPDGTPQPFVFDTWCGGVDANGGYDYQTPVAPATTPPWQTPGNNATIPLFTDPTGNPIIIKALQITVRVWDSKTLNSRQITIIQHM